MQLLTQAENGFDARIHAVRDEIGVAGTDECPSEIVFTRRCRILNGPPPHIGDAVPGLTWIWMNGKKLAGVESRFERGNPWDDFKYRTGRVILLCCPVHLRLEHFVREDAPVRHAQLRDVNVRIERRR